MVDSGKTIKGTKKQRIENLREKIDKVRDHNIRVISQTDNFMTLKREISRIESKGLTFEVDYDYYENIINDAFIKMKSCFKRDNSFIIMPIIEEMGVTSFFDYLIDGEILAVKQDKEEQKKKRMIEILQRRIEKASKKGDEKKETVEQDKLNKILKPEEDYNFLVALIARVKKEGALIEGSEFYEAHIELEKKLKKADKKRELEEKRQDNIDFTKGIKYDMREYVLELIFNKATGISEGLDRFLKGFQGELHLDLEHVYILYKYMRRNNIKNRIRIEGIFYYFVMYELYKALKEIKKATENNNVVKVNFNFNPDTFECETFSFYNRKYILDMITPRGYSTYYIEPENLNLITFLAVRDIEPVDYDTFLSVFKGAQDEVKQSKKGFLFDFLRKEEENNIFRYILNETYPIDHMNGKYQGNLYKDFIIKYFTTEVSKNWNMYNRIVKPIALDIIGSVIRSKLQNIDKLKDKDAVFINYISENRISIAIREDITEDMREEIFGDFYKKKMKLVTKPLFSDLVNGSIF